MKKNTDLQYPYYTGVLTINAADGVGAVELIGSDKMAIIVSIESSVAGSFAKVAKTNVGFAVSVVDDAGTAVDCSTTNAIVSYIAVKKTQ